MNEHTLQKDAFKHQHEVHKVRNDSKIVKLNNGKWMEYHPSSFVYASDMYQEFPSELEAKMKAQRDEYSANHSINANNPSSTSTIDLACQIQALQAQLDALRGSIPTPTSIIGIDNQTQVSQFSFNPTMMGGRNDQTNWHQPRNINKVRVRSTIPHPLRCPPASGRAKHTS